MLIFFSANQIDDNPCIYSAEGAAIPGPDIIGRLAGRDFPGNTLTQNGCSQFISSIIGIELK